MSSNENLQRHLLVASRLSSFTSGEVPIDEPQKHRMFFSKYCEHCKSDLASLTSFLSQHLGYGIDRIKFTFLVDQDNFQFDARVRRLSALEYSVTISIGAFLAIDDFALCVTPYYSKELGPLNQSASMKVANDDPNWHTRFNDYSSPQGVHNQVFGTFGFKDVRPITHLLTNSMLAWVILHEMAHPALGHLGTDLHIETLSKTSGLVVSASSDVVPTFSDIVQHSYAQELHCDYFASLGLFSLLKYCDFVSDLTSDEISVSDFWVVVLNSQVYMCLLLHKTEGRSSFRSPTHPLPLTRLFNTLVASEFYSQFLMERISPSAHADVRFSVSLVRQAVMHMYFCSTLLFRYDADPTGDARTSGRYKLNDHITDVDSLKWTLSVWNYRFGANFFLPGEASYAYIEEWKEVWDELFKSSVSTTGGIPPAGTISIFSELIFACCRAPQNQKIESSQGLKDVEKVRKYFVDLFLVLFALDEVK